MTFSCRGRYSLFLKSIVVKHSIPNNVKFSLVRRMAPTVQPHYPRKKSPTATYLFPGQQAQLEAEKHGRVGITEFLGNFPKVLATFKQECADFQVHEIDPGGRKVQLTDYTSSIQEDDTTRRTDQNHIICTLYKENVEHSRAVGFIAESLDIHPHNISFAGRKDKRSQSSQRISISTQELSIPQLARVSSTLFSENIRLGNFFYSTNPLFIGHLEGNHFNILLRDIRPGVDINYAGATPTTTTNELSDTWSMVDRAIQSLGEVGFINYFGLQRFGFNSHNIGLAVLRLEWEKAFDLILAPRSDDFNRISWAKAVWFSKRDPKRSIKHIPQKLRHGVNETGILLHGLAEYYEEGKGDMEKAYLKIPKIMRSFHITAVTSLLWNQVVSFRLRKFGMEVLPGDFVQVFPSSQSIEKIDDSPLQSDKTFKMLTEEDLLANSGGHSYSIYDVFLPVLGSQVSFYQNSILQQHYEKLLADHGLEADCLSKFHLRNEVAKGFYRPLIVRPKDLTYKIIPYDDDNKDNLNQFMPSDLDLMDNKSVHHDGGGGVKAQLSEEDGKKKDKLCALLSFTVGTSSYATMALREVIQTANFSLT